VNRFNGLLSFAGKAIDCEGFALQTKRRNVETATTYLTHQSKPLRELHLRFSW